MPLPDFDPDEQYLINAVKSPKATSGQNGFLWGCLIGTSAVAGYATYVGNVVLLLIAFAIVCGFRIWEEWYQVKWTPVWRSVLEKYETELAAAERRDAAAPQDGVRA